MRSQLNWKLPERRLHGVGQPHVGGPAWLHAAESWLGHADDLELRIFLGDLGPASDDRGIAAEPPLPERVTHNRDRMRARSQSSSSSAAGLPRADAERRTRRPTRTACAPAPSPLGAANVTQGRGCSSRTGDTPAPRLAQPNEHVDR